MRTYGQYCALARALDLVGDRWTLLIVRELLTLGPSRYTDLHKGLPGIATNLLVDRLRELEDAGVVERIDPSPPVATVLFQLTDRGRALEPAVKALGAWGGPTLGTWKAGEQFRSHWLILPLELHLADNAPSRRPVSIEVRVGDGSIVIEAASGTVRVRRGTATSPAALVSGPPDIVLAALLGRLPLTTARRRGLRIDGDIRAFTRVQPRTP